MFTVVLLFVFQRPSTGCEPRCSTTSTPPPPSAPLSSWCPAYTPLCSSWDALWGTSSGKYSRFLFYCALHTPQLALPSKKEEIFRIVQTEIMWQKCWLTAMSQNIFKSLPSLGLKNGCIILSGKTLSFLASPLAVSETVVTMTCVRVCGILDHNFHNCLWISK